MNWVTQPEHSLLNAGTMTLVAETYLGWTLNGLVCSYDPFPSRFNVIGLCYFPLVRLLNPRLFFNSSNGR